MEILKNRIDEDNILKNNIINYYEESKENINFKTKLIFALVESIKEENEQLFSKSNKKFYNIIFKFNSS
jgi:hypothetical protein